MGIRLTIRAIHPDGTTAESRLELDQARIALGRALSSDVLLPHASVASHHATLQVRGAGYALVDEGGINGTFVDGVKLVAARPRTMRSGEAIRIGPFRIELALGVPVAPDPPDAETAGRRLLTPAPRSLRFLNGPAEGSGIELPERGEGLPLGRAEEAFVRIDDAECSRVHARLEVDPDSVVVRDAESKNGILVNGRATSRRVLRDGDEIGLGATRLGYVDPRDAELRAIARLTTESPFATPIDEPAPAEVPADAEPTIAATGLEIVEVPEPETPSAAPRIARPKPPISADAMTDRLAFGLALLVLGLSIAGFVWLFGDTL